MLQLGIEGHGNYDIRTTIIFQGRDNHGRGAKAQEIATVELVGGAE